MTQYIDKNRVEEILRNLWKKDDGHNAEHRICYNKALQEVQCEIDTLEVKEIGVDLGDPKGDKSAEYIIDTKTLEVKEVDLENEIDKELDEE